MTDVRLSKSKILEGLQCPKKLHIQIHKTVPLEEDPSLQAIFERGNQIGQLARELYPSGKLIEHDQELHLAIEETERLLQNEPDIPLFEATFNYDGVLIRADILLPGEKGHQLIEVKSSSSVKPYHLNDCAIQTWVFENSGYPVEKIQLAHVNSQFVYQGDGNYEGLLHFEDITDKVRELVPDVPNWIEHCRHAAKPQEPVIDIGPHCTKPFKCGFIDHCWPEAEYPVKNLYRIGKKVFDLIEQGYTDIRDIPDDVLTNAKQEWIRQITLQGAHELKPEVADVINQLPYPRYHIDFETIMFAVPIWENTRPNQQLPFQWSCHIETSPTEMEHREFLDTSGQAPMRAFTETLLDAVGDEGPVFIYTSFEKTRMKEMALRYPDLADRIERLTERFIDLCKLAEEHYYHPEMAGSWSIKKVLPTVAPELSYQEMEVADGTAAQRAYLEIIDQHTNDERRTHLIQELKSYCELDTLAMVKVAAFLSG